MGKIVSVFELLARNTIYKILLIFTALGIAEIWQFINRLQEQLALQNKADVSGAGGSLELVIESSGQYGWYTIAFILISVILGFSTCNFGSVSGYTLKRLRISEWEIFLVQSAYNLMCYIMLMGVQLGLLLVMGHLYMTQADDVSSQTIFLAFYRHDFMHSILPMEEWMRYLTNLLMLGGVSVTVAGVPYFQRNGKFCWEAVVTVGIMAVGFEAGLGDVVPYTLTLIILGLSVFVASRVKICYMERKEKSRVEPMQGTGMELEK